MIFTFVCGGFHFEDFYRFKLFIFAEITISLVNFDIIYMIVTVFV